VQVEWKSERTTVVTDRTAEGGAEWPCKLRGSLQKLGSRSMPHISEVPHRYESNQEVLCKYSDHDQSKPGATL
jgi:hypothetical protein